MTRGIVKISCQRLKTQISQLQSAAESELHLDETHDTFTPSTLKHRGCNVVQKYTGVLIIFILINLIEGDFIMMWDKFS